MSETTTDFNFNTADEQRSFDVIPARTICTLHLKISAGGAGDGGWLKLSADKASEGLDCEFTVVDGQYANRKLWQLFTLRGTTQGHDEARKISLATFRAILESARGIRSDDKSEAAEAARKVSGWGDFDGLRFVALIGVRPPTEKYSAKNTILEVITPERQAWTKPEQISAKPPNAGAPATAATPPVNAIARPDWAKAQGGSSQ